MLYNNVPLSFFGKYLFCDRHKKCSSWLSFAKLFQYIPTEKVTDGTMRILTCYFHGQQCNYFPCSFIIIKFYTDYSEKREILLYWTNHEVIPAVVKKKKKKFCQNMLGLF